MAIPMQVKRLEEVMLMHKIYVNLAKSRLINDRTLPTI